MKKVYLKKGLLLGALSFAISGMTNVYAASDFPVTEIQSSPDQAGNTVTCIVSDDLGEVVGANVSVKGTTNGGITDADGKVVLQNVPANAILVVSYVGYATQEINIGNQTTVNVTITEDTQNLEEIVVVGYGIQKKVNLTGSIATLNTEQLEKRPITNLSQSLAGIAAGVSVKSSSNQPGDDNAAITVRGRGTLNTSSPLIIIDGVETDIKNVLPTDIENVTVLKDAASAAIYGSRAANGVILITTKKGSSGNLKINYDGYLAWESRSSDKIKFITNSADYMEYINEGYTNAKTSAIYSQETIDKFRADNGAHPYVYANSDIMGETFSTGLTKNHIISMNGGTDKIRFYGSFGYNDRPGIMNNAGYEQYSGRLSVESDIKPWITLGISADGYIGNMDRGAALVSNVWTYLAATSPTVMLIAPNGDFGYTTADGDLDAAGNNNPLSLLVGSKGTDRRNHYHAHFYGILKPVKGLTVTGNYSYEILDREVKTQPNWVYMYKWDLDGNKNLVRSTEGRTSVSQSDYKTTRYNGDVTALYENKFIDKLDFSLMVGASQELYHYHWFSASKYDLPDYLLSEMAAATADPSANGNSTEYVMQSGFGRLKLGWNDKYLFEFNLRADGSSRFAKGNRWGYFPSGSMAWRLDQEEFMQNFMENTKLSSLKIRGSYGSLGNNSVGNYAALALYTSSNAATNYTLNSAFKTGIAITALSNSALTWEKTSVFDVGLDFGFLKNKLTGTLEYYNKYTTDILMQIPAPAVHGSSTLPSANYGEMSNKGIEVTLSWQDAVGDFNYGISGNLTYNRNRVEKYKGRNPEDLTAGLSGANLVYEGYAYNSQYGYKVDRIIQTDADMKIVNDMLAANSNAFSTTGKPTYGDYLYKDLNGDGIVNTDDRTILSDGPDPNWYAGLAFNLGWKGIDFSVMMQGQFGASRYWMNDYLNTGSVRQGYQVSKAYAEGAWREGMTNAKYTRLLEYSTNNLNHQYCDEYVQNLAFWKVRNIQLGYTFPKKCFGGVIDRLRVYGSLENFFTITKFEGFDPETVDLAYPTMKQAVIGVNITF